MGLLNMNKLVVGYDLCDDYSQISYCVRGDGQGDVETLSSVAGETHYNIPTVLCKRKHVNQWFYGKEALRYAGEEQGTLVCNLVTLAAAGEPVRVEETEYDPVALLALFLKRSLGMLARISSPERIGALMITGEKLDYRMIEVLRQAVQGLRLKTDQFFFQNHTESFYNYMIRQPEEIWRFQSILCEYKENRMLSYVMECNRKTTPIAAYIAEKEYPFLSYEPMPEAEGLRREKQERLDGEFLNLAEEICRNSMISSVFLIGENFKEEWMKESLRFLCKGRRVFQGNNLYSKGACYGMLERLDASEAGKSHVFLGNDKLKANIGMKILRQGKESYYALLDAGVNWFEADNTLEFYLQEGNVVELIITSLIGRNSKLAQIILEDMPWEISRIKAHFYLSDQNTLTVELEDLGFGSIRQGSHRVWKEEIEL